jgi:hypothetical protein
MQGNRALERWKVWAKDFEGRDTQLRKIFDSEDEANGENDNYR